jgi:hypothetical protein
VGRFQQFPSEGGFIGKRPEKLQNSPPLLLNPLSNRRFGDARWELMSA